ncbi:MAG: CoA-binding protein [Deltaproteobacteria bacterium]|nr:CoA-binding protein [Deltaproteobacteria bacterium]
MIAKKPYGLERLFHPKSLAVVGASPKVGGFNWGGNNYIEASVSLGFQGKIYPVHPTADTVLGFKSYKSVRDIPGELDLVIFSISYNSVLPVMRDCVEKGVKFIHVFTAGFSETGLAENRAIENELVRLARQAGIRIVGPNCMGLYCPKGALAWNKEFPRDSGPVSFVSQSGQLAGEFVETGAHIGLRYNKVASYGNACDLQLHDFLNHLVDDEKTKVVGAYLEGLRDGEAFFEAAKRFTRKKPLVVWKGGLTEGGSRASQSHTSAIAGSAQIWEAVCRQTGIIPAYTMSETAATIAALLRQPLPKGVNVAILGGAGGGSVTMTDIAERDGLQVPHLSEGTIRKLEEFIPIQGNIIKNPLDVMGALFFPARATGHGSDIMENYRKLFVALREDPRIDALLFAQRVELFTRVGGRPFMNYFLRRSLDAMKEFQKPIYIVLEKGNTLDGEAARQDAQGQYIRAGIPTFDNFSSAARIIGRLSEYRRYLESRKEEPGF